MSEIDRLSGSGLYPALPIGDHGASGGKSGDRRPPQGRPTDPASTAAPMPTSDGDKPAKSLIDEYV